MTPAELVAAQQEVLACTPPSAADYLPGADRRDALGALVHRRAEPRAGIALLQRGRRVRDGAERDYVAPTTSRRSCRRPSATACARWPGWPRRVEQVRAMVDGRPGGGEPARARLLLGPPSRPFQHRPRRRAPGPRAGRACASLVAAPCRPHRHADADPAQHLHPPTAAGMRSRHAGRAAGASINYQLNLGYVLTFPLGGSGRVSMHLTHGTCAA